MIGSSYFLAQNDGAELILPTSGGRVRRGIRALRGVYGTEEI